MWYGHAISVFYENIWEVSTIQFVYLCGLLLGTTAGIGFGFWFAARILCKWRRPPMFRYMSYFMVNTVRCYTGVLLAVVLLTIPLVAIYVVLGGNSDSTVLIGAFNSLSGDFLHDSLSRLETRNGRYGLAFAIFGFYGLMVSFKAIAYIPKKIRVRDNFPTEESNFIYQLTSSGYVIVYCLLVNFFSYSKEFNSNRQLFYVVVISSFGELLKLRLSRKSPSDYILCLPFLVSIELMDLFMSRLSANSFGQLLVNLMWIILVRYGSKLYIAPIIEETKESGMKQGFDMISKVLKNEQSYIFMIWNIITRYNTLQKIALQCIQYVFRFEASRYQAIKQVFRDRDFDKLNDTLQSIIDTEVKLRNERKNSDDDDAAEPVIAILTTFSIESIANIMIFISTIFIWSFTDQLQVEEYGGLQQENYLSYTIFSFICMIGLAIADPYLLNALQLKYGWKVYEYLIYKNYCFAQRERYWTLYNKSYDECILQTYQRIDVMCFSFQYYFIISLTSFNLLLIIIGLQIIIINSYSPFVDYCAIFIFMFASFLFGICFWLMPSLVQIGSKIIIPVKVSPDAADEEVDGKQKDNEAPMKIKSMELQPDSNVIKVTVAFRLDRFKFDHEKDLMAAMKANGIVIRWSDTSASSAVMPLEVMSMESPVSEKEIVQVSADTNINTDSNTSTNQTHPNEYIFHVIRIIETQAPETTESPEKTEQVETNTEDIYYQPLSLELLLIKPKMKSISLLQDHIEHATAHLICNNEFENGVQSNGESYALVIVEKDKKDGEKNVVDDNDETDDLYSIDEMLDWAVSILLVLVAGLVAIPPIAFALMFIVLCSMLLTTSGRILLREFIVVAIASCVIPFSIMGIRSLSDL